eukprot:CAMPEP_0185727202 /NCGR_PEP_ID=MMETSP1171-20130828/2952_1 /TAXON_ID=374046 /ORGANISM="Helicotheca tamensis, Strain CCMP826" /LENGTH=542 /DNA_ID=CAMNT_0028395715 /DNA_START=188 /DNA_END=1816 /DNA_ORIENTATION=+
MAYAYWKTNRHNESSVFELFFRKNPFRGEYTIFCGLDEVLRHLSNFKFGADDIAYLRQTPALSHCDPQFFDDYLCHLDCEDVKVYAMREGSIAFPRVPLVVVRGPLGVCQLLETTLLTLVNYPSLIATNAARFVVAATGQFLNASSDGDLESLENQKMMETKKKPRCIEFGLRRAQGPDGGFSASKYSAVGGFDATSNVQAGKILGVPIAGTHAHAFVQAHSSLKEAESFTLEDKNGQDVYVLQRALQYRTQFGWESTNDGELAAFLAYAVSFPDTFLCLIDTYDTLRSGLRNFILVSLVLHDLGHIAKGIRLDSGDLSYLSIEVHHTFLQMAKDYPDRQFFKDLDIVASNDINEDVLHSLNKQGHAVTVFGIGTNLVTCQAQPALGCVYKLVEVDGRPRIKLSQDLEKVLIPGQKIPYRLYGERGWPLLDLMVGIDEKDHIEPGRRILCRHPFIEQKRVAVVAKKIVKLHTLVFDGSRGGVVIEEPLLKDTKKYVAEQIKCMRPDIMREMNPGQYKVSVSDQLFHFLHKLWQTETPVLELR